MKLKLKLNKTIYYTMMLLLLFTVSQIFILSGLAQQLQISSNTPPPGSGLPAKGSE